MGWIMPVIGGAMTLAEFLRKKKGYPSRHHEPFNFTPNPNDPELALRRRQALEVGSRDRMGTVDELARAGLIGSGASFGVLGESQNRTARILEDINSQVYGRQRGEQFDTYNQDIDWERDLAKIDYMNDLESTNQGMASVGELGGSMLQDWGRSRYLQPRAKTPKTGLGSPGYTSAWYDLNQELPMQPRSIRTTRRRLPPIWRP